MSCTSSLVMDEDVPSEKGLSPLIEQWTSALLQDYKPHRPRKKDGDNGDSTIAFGRTTKTALTPTPCVLTPKNSLQHHVPPPREPDIACAGSTFSRRRRQANASDEASIATSCTTTGTSTSSIHKRKPALRQMFTSTNGPEHLAKAQEKRRRQLTYAKEIRHAASKGNSMSLQIDSITRVVVQSFRKLINCERCALFLMDHTRNQLYFKPVGDPSSSTQVKVIRFSSNTGVAGWVATNQSMLNIKNAYADPRFNQEIDKQTNFRTRTILCMPVFDSSGDKLIGVIQMVNKMKDDGKALQKMAKNKKTDDKNHGYLEVYEPFSEDDETTLKECSQQVSAALEEVLAPTLRRKKSSNKNEESTDAVDEAATTPTDDGGDANKATNEDALSTRDIGCKAEDDTVTPSISAAATEYPTTTTEPHLTSISAADGRRRSSARRCSIGSLVQFVSTHSGQKAAKKDNEEPTARFGGKDASHAGISEALQRFEFRSATGPQISARRGSVVSNDPEVLEAASKRERMEAYSNKRRGGMIGG